MTKDNQDDTSVNNTDEETTEEETPILSWEEIGLGSESLAAIERMGYDKPTEVQQRAIPLVAEGKDLIVQAQTGSGKTLAFGLPILEKLQKDLPKVQAIVLSPTRELAVQVAEEISRAGKLGNNIVVPIFGGASMNAQISRIENGAQIVVGTPGRILDHLSRQTLKLDLVNTVVLDEADEMLDKGFLPDVRSILDYTPSEKQTMLFSATMPNMIKGLAKMYLKNQETITIGQAGLSINYDINHSYYRSQKLYKFVTLVNVLHTIARTKVLIFCNMKSDTENVAEYLHEEGFAVGFLSGDLSQAIRTKTLNMFKDGIIDIMVATDVAARGIDIEGISHVINYDLPDNQELYLHRTGRTGRAGRKGEAVSIIAPADILLIGRMERTMGLKFTSNPVPDKEGVAKALKDNFIERLRAMQDDGYPDDLSILADEMTEKLDPYSICAGLLTFLRQRGWNFEHGYDPENPEHKEQLFTRPILLGKQDMKEQQQKIRERRDSRYDNKNGSSRTNKSAHSKSADRKSADRKPARRNLEKEEQVQLTFSIGSSNEDINSPLDVVSMVTQIGGVRKAVIGKIDITENQTRVEVNKSASEKIIEAFKNRKKEPEILVSL